MPNWTVSQFAVEVALPVRPEPPQPPTPPIIQILKQTLKFTTLWEVIRTDGTIFRFTDHNTKLDHEGNTYTPVEGVQSTAHQAKAGLRSKNYEIRGVLTDNTITFDDLRAGKFRDAIINEYLIDWQYPWAGAIVKSTTKIATTTFDGEAWNAEVVGTSARLTRPVGKVYTRSCRHTLGDSGCKVNLTELQESGTVSVVVNGQTRFEASDIPTSADINGVPRNTDFYWAFGNITWVTGNNAGLKSEVKSVDVSSLEFVLQIPLPFDIEVGDTFTVTPGCDKTFDTCGSKFMNPSLEDNPSQILGNTLNFGGFPTIPGPDKILIGPERGEQNIIDKLIGLFFG